MNDLICNQTRIPRDQWRYGLRSSAATGCGWIATYNALRLMGYYARPEALIRYYECSVPLYNGNFGTFVLSPAVFFRQQGFQVQTCTKRRKFDALAAAADACILFYGWHAKHRFGIHFVALHRKDDVFVGYNTFRNSDGPDVYGESLEAFLKRHQYFHPVLFAVHKPAGRASGGSSLTPMSPPEKIP